MHPRAGHNNYEGKLRTTRGKQFSSRAGESRSKIARECDLLSQQHSFRMKQIFFITLLTAAALLLAPAIAQTPTQKDADDLNALIKDVQAQQAEISENQAKIEEKLAALTETIREARIFSSRGGR